MSEPSDPTDNVVHIRFKQRGPDDLPTPPVKKSRSTEPRPFCLTHFFEYDMDERTVICTRCGRQFDAFEALDSLGRNWANYDFTHRNVRAEIAELTKKHERITKQVSNLKTQRRRLVPNVRQDVQRVQSELWRYRMEKNPKIASALMSTIEERIAKVLRTLDAFGDEPAAESPPNGPEVENGT